MGRQTPRASLHWKRSESRNHSEASWQMSASRWRDGVGTKTVAWEVWLCRQDQAAWHQAGVKAEMKYGQRNISVKAYTHRMSNVQNMFLCVAFWHHLWSVKRAYIYNLLMFDFNLVWTAIKILSIFVPSSAWKPHRCLIESVNERYTRGQLVILHLSTDALE